MTLVTGVAVQPMTPQLLTPQNKSVRQLVLILILQSSMLVIQLLTLAAHQQDLMPSIRLKACVSLNVKRLHLGSLVTLVLGAVVKLMTPQLLTLQNKIVRQLVSNHKPLLLTVMASRVAVRCKTILGVILTESPVTLHANNYSVTVQVLVQLHLTRLLI